MSLKLRRALALVLMLLLPAQWSIALAADCCLRHNARAEEHAAHMQVAHQAQGEHQHHGAGQAKAGLDKKGSSPNCDMNCAACAVHHSACAVVEFNADFAPPPVAMGDTPYRSYLPDPLPDNLFRPPLAALV